MLMCEIKTKKILKEPRFQLPNSHRKNVSKQLQVGMDCILQTEWNVMICSRCVRTRSPLKGLPSTSTPSVTVFS